MNSASLRVWSPMEPGVAEETFAPMSCVRSMGGERRGERQPLVSCEREKKAESVGGGSVASGCEKHVEHEGATLYQRRPLNQKGCRWRVRGVTTSLLPSMPSSNYALRPLLPNVPLHTETVAPRGLPGNFFLSPSLLNFPSHSRVQQTTHSTPRTTYPPRVWRTAVPRVWRTVTLKQSIERPKSKNDKTSQTTRSP